MTGIRLHPRRLSSAGTAILLLLASSASADQGNGRLNPDILKRTKGATVYLRVTLSPGKVIQGSGFFGVEPGLILTNAHVLGMLRPESPTPEKVEVVIGSGERHEQTVTGIILGVDPESDLGLISVRGKDLPAPLIVDAHKAIQETDPVYIFGYPFGKELGKNVTVSRSSISSIRKDQKGLAIEKVQVEGGMHPGNSGGPVILDSGEVIGIAVSGVKASTINFAIPARTVAYFILGRRRAVVLGIPYKDEGKIKIPVRVEMVDPLKRIEEVWFETWTGDPGTNREALLARPEQRPGDSTRLKCALTYKDGVAQGEIAIPLTLPPKKVYWVQSLYKSSKKVAWNSALIYHPAPPVERKSAILKHRHHPGARTRWSLSNTGKLNIRNGQDAYHALTLTLKAEFAASTEEQLESDDVATVSLRPLRFQHSFALDNKPQDNSTDLNLKNELQVVSIVLQEKANGELDRITPKLSGVPKKSAKRWNDYCGMIIASLEAVSFPLTGEVFAAGKTWKATRPLRVRVHTESIEAVGDITYKYLGVRIRRAREEAVVEFAGQLRDPHGLGTGLKGRIRGEVAVDLARCQVVLVHTVIDVDTPIDFEKQASHARGTLNVWLERSLPDEEKATSK